MAQRHHIESSLNELLRPEAFKDYGPNGLQVEGRTEVRRIVSGVTASLAFIEAAIAAGADTLLVHHGLFWRGQDGRLTGWLKQRVARLLAADLNLFAYHLPLDAHAELGNNAQLGLRLGLRAHARFGDQDLGCIGDSGSAPSAASLALQVHQVLGRVPVLLRPGGVGVAALCGRSGFVAVRAAGSDSCGERGAIAGSVGVGDVACADTSGGDD